MGTPITDRKIYQEHTDDQGYRLERVEEHNHRLTDGPANQDQDGQDAERHLYRRADCDGHRQVELVLHRNGDCCYVFRRVRYDFTCQLVIQTGAVMKKTDVGPGWKEGVM